MLKLTTLVLAAILLTGPGAGRAYAQMYGPSVTVEMAKRAAAPAVAEALKNKLTMAVAIVDTHGELVYFEKMDDTQMGSVGVAIAKANSAARFKRPTKAFQDAVAAGGEVCGCSDSTEPCRSRAASRSWSVEGSSARLARRAVRASRTVPWPPLVPRP